MNPVYIPISKLATNTGQIDGLPGNPRLWTQEDLDRLKCSIMETPELLDARGPIVFPLGDFYIVIGGNMRLEACRQLGYKKLACYVLDKDTPVQKLGEIVLKDNGNFGTWDTQLLMLEWNDLPLEDLGIKLDEPKSYEDKNKEIDPSALGNEMVLKLKYQPADGLLVKARLGDDPRKELLKMLKYE